MKKDFNLHSRVKQKRAPSHPAAPATAILPPLTTMNIIGSRQCRWPYNFLNGELQLCGRECKTQYCPAHVEIAFGRRDKT